MKNKQDSGYRRLRQLMLCGILTILLTGCGGRGEPAADAQSIDGQAVSGQGTAAGSALQSAADSENEDTSEDTAQPELPELEAGEQYLISSGDVIDNPESSVPGRAIDFAAGAGEGLTGWLYIPKVGIDTGIYAEEQEETEPADHAAEEPAENAEPQSTVPDRATLNIHSYLEFIDGNTIIEGSTSRALPGMEGCLNPQLLDEASYIYIYSETEAAEFRIWAAYEGATIDLTSIDFLNYEEFAQFVDDVYNQRNMNLLTDESLREEVLGTWQLCTVRGDRGDGTSYYLLGTLTGRFGYEASQ